MKNTLTRKELGMRWFNCFYKFIVPISIFLSACYIVMDISEKAFMFLIFDTIQTTIAIATFVIYRVSKSKKAHFYPISLFYLTIASYTLPVLTNIANGLYPVILAIIVNITQLIYFSKRKHFYR